MSYVQHGSRAQDGFGIYVHVPYCRQLCPYCDFNVFKLHHANWPALLTAIRNELRYYAPRFCEGSLRSIYFGGGTPSWASVDFIASVLHEIQTLYGEKDIEEITLEADPGSIDAEKLQALRKLHIDRLSLGVQSFDDRILRTLARHHNARQAIALVRDARNAGFTILSIDLIAAVPHQTMQGLEHDLERVSSLSAEHVSVYGLTYEPGTEFTKRLKNGRLEPIKESMEIEMLDTMARGLSAQGYERYEISNYARPGYRAKHNSAYWNGRAYLGVGPGAHSFLGRERWGSVLGHDAYLSAWDGDQKAGSVEFRETLTPGQLLSERLMTGLRLVDGVDLAALGTLDDALAARVETGTIEAQSRQWIRQDGSRLIPTALGRRFADSLAALFM